MDLFNDIFGVAFYFGADADAIGPGEPDGYDTRMDRGAPITGGDVWDASPPDGIIDLFNDIFGVAFQFGHANFNLPNYAFTYDAENRLVSRGGGTITTTYVYDGQGQLVKRIGRDTTFYAGGIQEVTGPRLTKYYSFGGRRIVVDNSGTLSYLLADGLGSTTMVTNGSGNPVNTQEYYPYGRARGQSTVGLTTDKQFTGHQQEHGETYFMQSRFYDALAGRFLQPDSIVPDPMNPQSLNRYSYVIGNPLRYTDPTGRCHGEPFSFEDDQLCFDRLGEITWRDAPPAPREVSEHPNRIPRPEGAACMGFEECLEKAEKNREEAAAEEAKAWDRYLCKQYPDRLGCAIFSCLTWTCLSNAIQIADIAPVGVAPGIGTLPALALDLAAFGVAEVDIIMSGCSLETMAGLSATNLGNLAVGVAGTATIIGAVPATAGETAAYTGISGAIATC